MGEVPGMYWFIFWCAVVVISFTMAWLGGRAAHEQKMKALEILRMYAERGAEPPASISGPLLHSMEIEAEEEKRWKQGRRRKGNHPHDFTFGLCMAIGFGLIAWWRYNEGSEPQWLFYGAIIFGVVSASGAISGLVNALTSRRD